MNTAKPELMNQPKNLPNDKSQDDHFIIAAVENHLRRMSQFQAMSLPHWFID